jgi:hypothetical protein
VSYQDSSGSYPDFQAYIPSGVILYELMAKGGEIGHKNKGGEERYNSQGERVGQRWREEEMKEQDSRI